MNFLRCVLVLTFMICSFLAKAQSSFSISPTFVEAQKPANVFVFYNFCQFTNHTTDTLKMRWVKSIETRGHGGTPPPEEWETAINDPVNIFDPADSVASADFTLAPNVSLLEKFVFSVFPNGVPGSINAKFTFYALDFPADSVEVNFLLEGTEYSTSTQDLSAEVDFKVFPNPTNGPFQIDNPFPWPVRFRIEGMAGNLQESGTLPAKASQHIDSRTWSAGWYVIKMEGKSHGKPILIQR